MKKLIVISDWVNDTLACQEFRSAVEGFIQKEDHPNIYFVSSLRSTIHTSFLISQVVETEERLGRPQKTIIFMSTDHREENDVAYFVIIRLKSGIYICGPNADNVFSMIKSKIDLIFDYKGLEISGQFHSRDLYSRVCAHLIEEMEDELELEELHTNIIPVLSDFYVAHIDSFGNIKTTIPISKFKGKYEFGDELFITINKIRKRVIFISNIFTAQPGILIIYPGSSGKKDDPFLEIAVSCHFTEKGINTGKDVFGNLRPGMQIKL
jgi:hypothetical protein